MKPGDYDELRSAVERAGFASTIHPDAEGEVHVVLATLRRDSALGGNSFRASYRSGRWFLFTWTPNFYRLPIGADPIEVCVACLQSGTQAISQIPSAIVERHSLESLSEDEYDLACQKRDGG